MKQLPDRIHFLKLTALSIILAAGICTGLSSFSVSPKTERYYKVAGVGQEIPAANKTKLLKAFRAQYGATAMVKEIRLVEKDGGATWLAFLGGGDGTPTVLIKLETVNGFLSIDLGGPVGIRNCLTTKDCSCCNTSCACSSSNGGQNNCGSGGCTEETTTKILPSTFTTVLAG